MSRPPRKGKAKAVGAPASANVSTLKAQLGRFLRRVRSGEEVVVLDRQHPIAKIIPFEDAADLLPERPARGNLEDALEFIRANRKKRPATKLKKTAAAYLSDDRGTR